MTLKGQGHDPVRSGPNILKTAGDVILQQVS